MMPHTDFSWDSQSTITRLCIIIAFLVHFTDNLRCGIFILVSYYRMLILHIFIIIQQPWYVGMLLYVWGLYVLGSICMGVAVLYGISILICCIINRNIICWDCCI